MRITLPQLRHGIQSIDVIHIAISPVPFRIPRTVAPTLA